MKNSGLCLAATLIATLGASAASAHHSHAMFDLQKEETVTGTVRSFVFTNPHVYLYLTALDEGKTINYVIEMSFVQNMIQRGITATTLQPGDKVTVVFNPLRNGQPGGNYVSLTDAHGKTYDTRETGRRNNGASG